MDSIQPRKRGGQPGNMNRAGAAQLVDILLSEARRDKWDRVRRGCSAVLERAADGDLTALAWVYDRIAGKPMPMLPDVDSDRAVSITWSFGPAVVEHQPALALDSPRVSSAQPGDDLPG